MSIPITACLVSKAARGDQAAYAELRRRWLYNQDFGAFSIWPCKCDPPCPEVTEEQVAALSRQIEAAGKEG